MAKSAISTQSKFNPKKIMIMKKVYIKPELEIFEVEPAEGMMLKASLNMGGDTDGDGEEDRINPDDPESGWEDLSNKRNPWGKSPWE